MPGARRAWAVVLAGLALLGAVAITARVVGPAWVVSAIEREAQRFVVPRVSIGGLAAWQLWPTPVLVLDRLALSDAAGSPLARVARVTAELDIEAIMTGGPALARLEIERPEIFARQDEDGAWNFAGWLVAQPGDRGETVLPFRQLEVSDGRVQVSAPALELAFDRVMLGLAPGGGGDGSDTVVKARLSASNPLALALEGGANARLHLGGDAVRLTGLNLSLDGRMGERGRAAEQLRALTVTMGLDEIVATAGVLAGRGLRAEIDGEPAQGRLLARLGASAWRVEQASWALDDLDAALSLAGAAGPVSIELSGDATGGGVAGGHVIEAKVRAGHASLPHPRDAAAQLALTFAGAVRAEPAAGSASGQFDGGFDHSRFDLAWTWSSAPAPFLTARMALDRLVLDAYLPAGEASAAASGGLSLPRWQDWPLSAELRVGTLVFRGLTSQDARLDINAGMRP